MFSSFFACLRPSEFRPVLVSLALLIASWFGVAQAFEPFVVRDIRVEGLQRTEPGTVFGYLPVKVGDTLTDERAAGAVKALFNAGLFRDVRLVTCLYCPIQTTECDVRLVSAEPCILLRAF